MYKCNCGDSRLGATVPCYVTIDEAGAIDIAPCSASPVTEDSEVMCEGCGASGILADFEIDSE
jgi:hypothetical protein